jgi:hypothetical protein
VFDCVLSFDKCRYFVCSVCCHNNEGRIVLGVSLSVAQKIKASIIFCPLLPFFTYFVAQYRMRSLADSAQRAYDTE